MGHYALAAIWALLTSACAGLGGAYLAHAFNFRGGDLHDLESGRVGIGLMLLVLAWFFYRFGAKRFLP